MSLTKKKSGRQMLLIGHQNITYRTGVKEEHKGLQILSKNKQQVTDA